MSRTHPSCQAGAGSLLPGVLVLAGVLGLPGEGASRVLPPRASEVVSRTFQALDPAWRLDRASIDRSQVRVTLCPVPQGACLEALLTDPDEGCPDGDQAGLWCLRLPPGDDSRRLREVLVPLLSAQPADPLWEVPGGQEAGQETSGGAVGTAAPGASGEAPMSRWWATIGFLALWTLGFWPGVGVAWLIRARVPAVERHRGPMALLAVAVLLGLVLAGLSVVPWRAWGILLGGGGLFGVGFLSGLAGAGPPARALRRLGWVWVILALHGIGAEALMGAGAPEDSGTGSSGRPPAPDRSAMIGPTCSALFPEDPPSLEPYRAMRRALRQQPPPRLWLHLGGDTVLEEPAGQSLPALIGALRPQELHWNGGLSGTATDVHLRQALAWTRRDPPPAGVVLYLRPATDLPPLGERNACCGAEPLFRFPDGEPRLACDHPDLRGRWRVLLGQTPLPLGVDALQESHLARRFGEVWGGAFGRLLAGRDDRAAVISRLRMLLPWVRDRLGERGVRLLIVLIPSPRDLGPGADAGLESREWVQTMEICRVLDLPCRNAREAWNDPEVAPFLPGTWHLSPAGERHLARWVAGHLASLEDSPQ